MFNGYNSENGEYNKINLRFDNKYNYEMTQLDTQNILMSSFWNIEPLKSQAVYFFQSVPDEIIEKPYIIEFSLTNGNTICRYSGIYQENEKLLDSSDMLGGLEQDLGSCCLFQFCLILTIGIFSNSCVSQIVSKLS